MALFNDLTSKYSNSFSKSGDPSLYVNKPIEKGYWQNLSDTLAKPFGLTQQGANSFGNVWNSDYSPLAKAVPLALTGAATVGGAAADLFRGAGNWLMNDSKTFNSTYTPSGQTSPASATVLDGKGGTPKTDGSTGGKGTNSGSSSSTRTGAPIVPSTPKATGTMMTPDQIARIQLEAENNGLAAATGKPEGWTPDPSTVPETPEQQLARMMGLGGSDYSKVTSDLQTEMDRRSAMESILTAFSNQKSAAKENEYNRNQDLFRALGADTGSYGGGNVSSTTYAPIVAQQEAANVTREQDKINLMNELLALDKESSQNQQGVIDRASTADQASKTQGINMFNALTGYETDTTKNALTSQANTQKAAQDKSDAAWKKIDALQTRYGSNWESVISPEDRQQLLLDTGMTYDTQGTPQTIEEMKALLPNYTSGTEHQQSGYFDPETKKFVTTGGWLAGTSGAAKESVTTLRDTLASAKAYYDSEMSKPNGKDPFASVGGFNSYIQQQTNDYAINKNISNADLNKMLQTNMSSAYGVDEPSWWSRAYNGLANSVSSLGSAIK